MNCKNCGKELETEEIVCGQCGYDNGAETEECAGKINPWKIAFPATVSLGLLLVLSWLLFYGVNGYWLPRANNIYNKDSYTVSDERLAAGRDTVVATLGKNKLTNAQLQVFYSRVCADFSGEYSSSAELDKEIYDENTGLTWQQYLLEVSLNTWKQYRILTDMALDAGFEMPAEHREYLDGLADSLAAAAEKYDYASVEEMLSDDICSGCTLEDYKYYLELYYYSNLYYEELSKNIVVDEEEIEAYFEANEDYLKDNDITKGSGPLVDIRNIYVKVESDGDVVTPGNWEDCKASADSILKDWLSNDPTEESFAQLATEKSQDTSTKSKGGLMSYLYNDYLTKVDVRYILLTPEGGTTGKDGLITYTDKEWEDCRKRAQEIYDEYLAGERTEESFSSLAAKLSKEENITDGGLLEDVEKNATVEAFDAWIFDESRQPGDVELIKTQYGYHIVYFVHVDEEMNDWVFAQDRKAGDYTVVKADEGYHVVYFVEGEDGWHRICRLAVMEEKSNEQLQEIVKSNELSAKYNKILLCED